MMRMTLTDLLSVAEFLLYILELFLLPFYLARGMGGVFASLDAFTSFSVLYRRFCLVAMAAARIQLRVVF